MNATRSMMVVAAAGIALATASLPTRRTSATDAPYQLNIGTSKPIAQWGPQGYYPGPLPSRTRTSAWSAAPSIRSRSSAESSIPSLPRAASLTVIEPATCQDEAYAYGVPVLCGYVPVPLDWEHPLRLGRIKIYFELYRAAPAPTESAILNNHGGPGNATTQRRWVTAYLFGPILGSHDALLIDNRGTGLSGTIDCGDLQHGTVPYAQAVAECAQQLGQAASRYGAGDVAQDTDAVRAALGYEKVDYFAGSYGGVDVQAYATRFGDHLRSIILDSPLGTPGLDPLVWNRARLDADRLMVGRDCRRSPACSADHPFPEVEFDLLVWTIRLHPVEGDAFDFFGNLTHVVIDEKALLTFLVDNPQGNYHNTGELLAAGAALWRGDAAPLLRLGAEWHWAMEGDAGDPTYYSSGANRARACVDSAEHWNWSAPVSVRQDQYDAAIGALPPWHFAPFSREAATGPMFDYFGRNCLWWEKPTPSSPVVLPHAHYPDVPTLVFSGDLDAIVPLEITSKVAALYPNSILLRVAEAGHGTWQWQQCVGSVMREFVETLKVTDTSCGSVPDYVWPAVGRFPLLAREARPAEVDPSGINLVGPEERKVATVAVSAATDAAQRAWFWWSGPGLRGGSYETDYDDLLPVTITLTDYAYSRDVAVSGTVLWNFGSDASFKADLTVVGAGTAGGTLHVDGAWMAGGAVGKFKVTGTLGGKSVAVLVPGA
jgi:pimeloyl-ACP methyl ester carboxylesterase